MQKGFTLIELVISITVIAILSAIIVASVFGVVAKSKDAKIESDISQISREMDLYYMENYNFTGYSLPSKFLPPSGCEEATEYTVRKTTEGYVVFHKLCSSNKYWCADSEGNIGQFDGAPGGLLCSGGGSTFCASNLDCSPGQWCDKNGSCHSGACQEDLCPPGKRCDFAGLMCEGYCGNGYCEADNNETCTLCISDCGMCTCNPACSTGQVCMSTGCCAPKTNADCQLGIDCGAKSDGCIGLIYCPDCPTGKTCNVSGVCVDGPACGDSTCGPGECSSCQSDCDISECCDVGVDDSCNSPLENCNNCSADCGGFCCGNGICEPEYGEDCSCSDCAGNPECAPCGDGTCDPGIGEDCLNCSADCGDCCGNDICDSDECTICPDDCDTCIDCGICIMEENSKKDKKNK